MFKLNRLAIVMMAADKVDTGLMTGDQTSKVIQFNPTGIVTPGWEDSLKAPENDVEKVEYDNQFALLGAREFDEAYGRVSDVIDAAEEARDRLSAIPLGFARYCQGFFSRTDKGQKLRLKKYAAMCQIAGKELAKRHGQAFTVADSYSTVMGKFKQGRYWVRLCSEARQALKHNIDLKAKIHNSDDPLYTNTRQVATTAATLEGQARAKKVEATAGTTTGTGTGDGQQLGEGKADAQSLKLMENAPEVVRAQLIKVANAVGAMQYEKDQKAAKRADSNTVLTSRVLAICMVLLDHVANGRVDGFDIGVIATDIADLVQTGEIPDRIKGQEFEDGTEEEQSTEDLADEPEEDSAELPGVDTEQGEEAPDAAANE